MREVYLIMTPVMATFGKKRCSKLRLVLAMLVPIFLYLLLFGSVEIINLTAWSHGPLYFIVVSVPYLTMLFFVMIIFRFPNAGNAFGLHQIDIRLGV